ncbi:MAG: DUF1700 domain-containing protein [Phenylobacterium sp.]|jgi:uncharacterized membrane protein|uniref:DUF1700 domain-containing protein n=1 Tax=Phenylobacterium sp. TaxID=1871053 RepID=UPI002A32E49A|nr:DUF1700 domain-containing protein [Phenylobacterium sp.]MDD3837564.1 DUF1700 domain-containing protein [Phenylobacterium sp.]MDX9998674.1 DUF1700 domain-containing protein [Phenylobacterium sp.]
MTRQDFLARLREGLRGLPAQTIDDIVADYEAHFVEGEAAGRSEADVAQALGDPDRLARELRAEAGLRLWEEQKNPSAAVGAVFAVIGLGALDLLIVLPVLIGVAGALFGIAMAVVAVFVAGGAVFVGGPFFDPPGGVATAIFAGLGLIAGSISAGAVLTLITIGLVNALVWYGRLHFRLLKPAL